MAAARTDLGSTGRNTHVGESHCRRLRRATARRGLHDAAVQHLPVGCQRAVSDRGARRLVQAPCTPHRRRHCRHRTARYDAMSGLCAHRCPGGPRTRWPHARHACSGRELSARAVFLRDQDSRSGSRSSPDAARCTSPMSIPRRRRGRSRSTWRSSRASPWRCSASSRPEAFRDSVRCSHTAWTHRSRRRLRPSGLGRSRYNFRAVHIAPDPARDSCGFPGPIVDLRRPGGPT
jgi:hypothetical protein